jgi:hypothetical protein
MAYCTIPRIGLSNFLHQFRAITPSEHRKPELQACNLDVFQLSSTSRLSRGHSSQKWKYVGREMAGKFILKMPDFHVAFRWSFTYRKSTTWDPQLYFPSEGRRAEDFFSVLKNPTASAGFEPAKLGFKGQQATSRPTQPLTWKYSAVFWIMLLLRWGCLCLK